MDSFVDAIYHCKRHLRDRLRIFWKMIVHESCVADESGIYTSFWNDFTQENAIAFFIIYVDYATTP